MEADAKDSGAPCCLLVNPLKLIKSLFVSAPRFAATDCFERVRSGAALLIDVREPREWIEGIAEHAVLLPLSDLTGGRAQWKPFLAANSNRELLLYCGAGVRSAMAARVLASESVRAANAGSFAEWSAAGWPVVRPVTSR
ncbi:MAG: rhodanese-like domain-containing protein [Opitutaceae bacterium]